MLGRIGKALLVLVLLITVGLSSFLPQNPEKAQALSDTTWYWNDDSFNMWGYRTMSCPASDNCKLVYDATTDGGSGYLVFKDCNNESCSSAESTIIDGPNCVVTNCAQGFDVDNPPGFAYGVVYCVAEDDCKVFYQDSWWGDLYLIDCDSSDCSNGTRTQIAGSACATTGCRPNGGGYLSIFCVSGDDCKLVYQNSNDLYFVDCDNSVCSSGVTTLLDGGAGCSLTNCSTTATNSSYRTIYCSASDDCKIAYGRSAGTVATSHMRFADCANSACTAGTTVNLDGIAGCVLTGCVSTGLLNTSPAIYCPTSSDCKVSYYESDLGDLRFVDCANESCSTGTTTLVDGNTGCPLTGCNSSADVGDNSSIYCVSATDCRIGYYDSVGDGIRVANCDNADCTAGTTTLIDGSTGCELTNCDIGKDIFAESTIHCTSVTDCKVSYAQQGSDTWDDSSDIYFADCDDEECAAGSITVVAGDKMVDFQGPAPDGFGDWYGNWTRFGNGTQDTILKVSEATYPDADGDFLGTGTNTLDLHVDNSISGGTLTWHLEIGYCTVSDNCATRTIHASSSDLNYDSSTTGSQIVTATAGSETEIPGPVNSKRLYVALVATANPTGFIEIQAGGNHSDGFDSNVTISGGVGGAPTSTPTPTPAGSSGSSSSGSSSSGSSGSGSGGSSSTPTPTSTPSPTPATFFERLFNVVDVDEDELEIGFGPAVIITISDYARRVISNATVYVDGEYAGKTDGRGQVVLSLANGEYDIEVEYNGERVGERIKVTDSKTDFHILIKSAKTGPAESDIAPDIFPKLNLPATGAVALTVLLVSFANFLTSIPSFSSIAGVFSRALTGILIYFKKKKPKPWGVVYDSVTKLPIDPAVVSLFKAGSKVGDRITDIEGRFGFLVERGKYSMSVIKTDYSFPSKKISGGTDYPYDSVYLGGEFDVNEPDAVIHNIPLDPVRPNWNQLNKPYYSHPMRDRWINRILNLIIFGGFVYSVLILLIRPSPINAAIIVVYLVAYLIRHINPSNKKWGYVLAKETGKALSFAVVKVHLASADTEVAKSVADAYGRYYILVGPGAYYLTVAKKVEGGYEEVFESKKFEISRKKGIIDRVIYIGA